MQSTEPDCVRHNWSILEYDGELWCTHNSEWVTCHVVSYPILHFLHKIRNPAYPSCVPVISKLYLGITRGNNQLAWLALGSRKLVIASPTHAPTPRPKGPWLFSQEAQLCLCFGEGHISSIKRCPSGHKAWVIILLIILYSKPEFEQSMIS